jgi:hypothetical protein
MKKFVVLSLISFLVLAFGATVYGQEKAPVLEFKASGWMDVIGEYKMNVIQPGAGTSAYGGTSTNDVVYGPPPAFYLPYGQISAAVPSAVVIVPAGGTPPAGGTQVGGTDLWYTAPKAAVYGEGEAYNKKNAVAYGRGRLKFDALMGKDMSGTFQFEFDSTRWGERVPAGSTAQRNYSGYWGVSDRSSLELKHMYFSFGVPWIPVPTTIVAGIQPIGIRPSIFMSTDGPGITAAFKVDPATIKLIWAKPLEGKDWQADDDDVYAIEANAKISTFTLGGYYALFNWNTYPAAKEGAPGWPTDEANVWWAGLYADGKLGPVNLNFDFCYDYGKISPYGVDPTFLKRDVDLRGWGTILNVGFPWEKFLFGVQGIYGSGADQKKTAAKPLPGAPTPWDDPAGIRSITSKVGAFLVPGGTEASNTHALVVDGGGINRGNSGFEPAADYHSRSGFGGLWIAKLYAAFQVSPEFNTRIEGMYIGDTTKNGNTIGNAVTLLGTPRDDKSIGIEIDWYNTLAIYKNLTFQFGLGYLLAGDAMDYYAGTIATPIGDLYQNSSPKNPYIVVTNLTYSF